jgi:Regulatory CLIP domain of proteinases
VKDKTCETPDSAPGKCVPISECASVSEIYNRAKQSAQSLQFLEDSHCGFDEDQVIYTCCANKPLPLPYNSMCGWSRWSPVTGLIREQRTKIDDYPWTALILYETRKSFLNYLRHSKFDLKFSADKAKDQPKCEGTLLSHQYVLTAASCVQQLPPNYKP